MCLGFARLRTIPPTDNILWSQGTNYAPVHLPIIMLATKSERKQMIGLTNIMAESVSAHSSGRRSRQVS